MTSRERVLNAINHKESDRIPVDLGSTPSSGISAIAYNNLKKHIGMNDGHTRVYDVVQQIAQVEDPIINDFGIDVLDIGRTFNTSDSDWHDVTLADGSTAHGIMPVSLASTSSFVSMLSLFVRALTRR